jgi:4-hydroxy-L-threonine phosphate dehydrogenase PdxA
MEKSDKIIVGISIGDLNGIGIEVILKTFQDNWGYKSNFLS